jgi:uncharacterized protein (TIGR02466 family)
MNVDPHFSSFIADDLIDNVDFNRIIDYSYKLKEESKSLTISNAGGWHSPTLNIEEEPLRTLFDKILLRLNDLHQQLGFKKDKKQEISNAWININGNGHSNVPHTHPRAFFSGCFYVRVPRNSGRIVFDTPVETMSWAYTAMDIEKRNQYNNRKFKMQPVDGLLLTFSPWLLHYVEMNESDKDRISIAFNSHITT